MDNNKTDLQKLADFVSSEVKIAEYDEKINDLPDKYKELIKIDKDIIDILNKMENKKPMKYELLGKFQKMFLLNKYDLNHQIKLVKKLSDNFKSLYEEKSQEEKNKKTEAKKQKAEAQKQKAEAKKLEKKRTSIRLEFEKKIKYIERDVKTKKKFKFSDLKKIPNFKNMELKTKIKKFIEEYGIKVNNSIDKLTLSQIYEQVFNKKWKDEIFRNIKLDKANQSRRRSKYKKLLKDINYIKKYMKYKMKYYIMLKKRKKIKN